VRVVIAEDLVLLREGMSRLLQAYGFEVVAAVGDATSLSAVLDDHPVDIVILDVRMPPTYTNEGLVAAIQARERRPGLPVIVLSQYVEQIYARELLASGTGAIGYLLKDRVGDVPAFVEAVRQVAAGATVLDPKVVAAMVTRASGVQPLTRLTAREREVLSLMAQGRSNMGIASALVITENAVSKHINSIFSKLDLPGASDDNRRVLAVLTYLND
jgi:DNA-binding NarL/FixJ family response regulator